MNERIRAMALQAGIDFFNSTDPEFQGREYCEAWTEQQEKFAELIVRECVKTVARQELMSFPEHKWEEMQIGYNDGVRTAAKKIKEHFGVDG